MIVSAFRWRDKKKNDDINNIKKKQEDKKVIYFDYSDIKNSNINENDEIPVCIRSKYTNDLNLIAIHKALRKKIFLELLTIPELEKKKNKHLKLSKSKTKTKVERNWNLKESIKIEKEIEEIAKERNWEEYKELAKPVLDEYVKVMSLNMRGKHLIAIEEDDNEDEDILNKRLECIYDYLHIVKDLSMIKLEIIHEVDSRQKCQLCGRDISELETGSSGLRECLCGNSFQSLCYHTEFKEGCKTTNSDSAYDNESTFVLGLNILEGKFDKKIPTQEMFKKFDSYCEDHEVPIGFDIRRKGTGDKMSLSFLNKMMAVKDYKGYPEYSKYFNVSPIIGHMYWGWELANFDSCRDQIIQDYRDTQPFFPESSGEDRTSNLNVNIRIWYHLKMRGIYYPLKRLRFPDSQDSIEYHDDTMRKMCEKAGKSNFVAIKGFI